MLLLRRLKFMTENKLERTKVVKFAMTFHVPKEAQSWLLNNGIEDLTNLNYKLLTKVFLSKELPDEFFKKLRIALRSGVQFKKDFYLPSDANDSFVIDAGKVNQCKSPVKVVAKAPLLKDDSKMVVDSSVDNDSFVKRKKIKLGECSDSNVVYATNIFPDNNAQTEENKNGNSPTQTHLKEPLILPQLYSEPKESVNQELFVQNDKSKETTGNSPSEKELQIVSSSSNDDIKDLFVIDTGTANQRKNAIDETAFVENDLKMLLDLSSDSCNISPAVGKKRKRNKTRLSKHVCTEDGEVSNIIHKLIPRPDNKNGENRNSTDKRHVSSLLSLSFISNEQEEKHVYFCKRFNSKDFPSNPTENISNYGCVNVDEKDESVSTDDKDEFLKQIELRPSPVKIKDPISKVQDGLEMAFNGVSNVNENVIITEFPIDSNLLFNPKQNQSEKMTEVRKENNVESPCVLDGYIENVLYKLVDEVAYRINNEIESSFEKKSVQESLIPSNSSANEYENFSVVGNNCQTFFDVSNQGSVGQKVFLSEVGTKSNLFNYRDEVNLNNVSATDFSELDCGNEDSDKERADSDDESESSSSEHSLDEDDLKKNKNSTPCQVNDSIQSNCDLTPEEASTFAIKLPRLSKEIAKWCDTKDLSEFDTEKELPPKLEVQSLLNDPDTNVEEGKIFACDTDDKIELNKSNEFLEVEIKSTEESKNGISNFLEIFPEKISQPVMSTRKLEKNCNIDGELKGNDNKENVESSIHLAQNAYVVAEETKLEVFKQVNQSDPQIAEDKNFQQKISVDQSLNSHKASMESDCMVSKLMSQENDLLLPTEPLDLLLKVLNSPIKQLRTLRQRKTVAFNPNEPITSLKMRKRRKTDQSDPVLTSNLSLLTLNSPSRNKPANSVINTEKGCGAKFLRKKDVECQTESDKGYNLRSRKPLIQPSKLNCPK